MGSAVYRGLWLASLGHLVIELCNNYLPVLYPLLIPRMGLTFTQVGFIALAATTGTTLAQPLFGYLSDRWGANRLTAYSIIWIGLVMGLVGFAGSYPLLLVLIMLGALGSAAFHPAGAVLAAADSGSKRGAGLSIFSVGGNVGTALSPLWMGAALAALGTAGTATLIPVGLAMGLAIYLYLRRNRRAPTGSAPAEADKAPAAQGYLVGLLVVTVAMMFRSWFQVALSTYLPTWVEQSGGSVALGGQVLALMLFAVSAGSLAGGSLGDRFGHWQMVLVAALVMPVGLWGFLQTTGWPQTLWLILTGVAIGATYPTSIILALESWPRQVGLASGLLMGVGWWPGGVGASVTGYLADHYSLGLALATLVLAPLAMGVCILVYAALLRQRRAQLASATES